jgi:hypothetical protein
MTRSARWPEPGERCARRRPLGSVGPEDIGSRIGEGGTHGRRVGGGIRVEHLGRD